MTITYEEAQKRVMASAGKVAESVRDGDLIRLKTRQLQLVVHVGVMAALKPHNYQAGLEVAAFDAGKNCAIDGPDKDNCDPSHFAIPELTAKWLWGQAEGERALATDAADHVRDVEDRG